MDARQEATTSTLRFTLRTFLGGLVGLLTALASVLVADLTGTRSPIVVFNVLAVALVGLGLGAAAAAYAYVAAGLVVILLVLIPAETGPLSAPNVLQIGAFVIGAPFLVILALRADRARQAEERARSVRRRAEQQAEGEREASLATRAQLHAALRRAEQERSRFEEVAEAIPEPLIVYDEEGRGTYANRAALRLFGRSFYDRAPDDWGRVAEPRDEQGNELARDGWPQVRARREAFRARMLVRLPMSGQDLLIDVEGTPIPDGGCVLLLRDVGKEEAERRRLSRFASFVAHELRNPLAVAKARVELTQRESGLPARASDHASRALESVDAAIGILERLEQYSRAETGRLEAQVAPFDLAAAVDAAVERLRARGAEREVQVSIDGAPEVVGDRQLSEQAITNLLVNADRYAHPGPVSIAVRGNHQVELRVADAGPGIADDIAEVIFRDRVSSGRGLGLGLYLVHAAMQAQGGSVHLEQRRPHAVFALRWPAKPPR